MLDSDLPFSCVDVSVSETILGEQLANACGVLTSHWGSGDLKPNPIPEAAAVLPLLQHMPTKFRHSIFWANDEQQRLVLGLLGRVQVDNDIFECVGE